MNTSLVIESYMPDVAMYAESDTLFFGLLFEARTATGFISDVNLSISDGCPSSFVEVRTLGEGISWRNLSLESYRHFVDGIGRSEKASVQFGGVDRSHTASFILWTGWALRTAQNESQLLRGDLELVYCNGTSYKEVNQPFKIDLVATSNGDFGGAKEIRPNEVVEAVLGGGNDVSDFYKVYVEAGMTPNITMTPRQGEDYDLYLYSADDKDSLAAFSSHMKTDSEENLEFTIDHSGWWYIEVRFLCVAGIYELTLREV